MAIKRGPSIVIDGLVLCLDAADRNSYSGIGTTIYDLSGNNYTGTLVNSVVFDSEKGGCFYFDSVNPNGPYINTSYQLNNHGTLSIWFKGQTQDSDGGSILRPLIFQGNYVGGTPPVEAVGITMLRSGLGTDSNKVRYYSGSDDSTLYYFTTSITYNDDRWHNAVLVRDVTNSYAYMDGVLLGTFTSTANIDKSTNIQLGGSSTLDARRYLGKIACSSIYTKILSSAEILQNYNAIRSRFLLT